MIKRDDVSTSSRAIRNAPEMDVVEAASRLRGGVVIDKLPISQIVQGRKRWDGMSWDGRFGPYIGVKMAGKSVNVLR
jgi:hypothetical protein